MNLTSARPSLPLLADYTKHLERIWQSHYVSNFATYNGFLEEQIRKYLGVQYVHAVANCDIGLLISFAALALPEGSQVILPSFTFNASINAILWNRLEPVFSDINPNTLTLDWHDVAAKITPQTSAILAVTVFGNPCDFSKLKPLARSQKLGLVCDAASGLGSIYRRVKVGSQADITVFSLSGTKIITAGEGGLIATNNKAIADKVQTIRNYGITQNYISSFPGINGKMSELHAALGTLALRSLDSHITKRQRIAAVYNKELQSIKGLRFQQIRSHAQTNYGDFCLLVPSRDALANYLQEHGVQTKKYFLPLHMMPYFQKYSAALPNTETVWRSIICLPMYNELKLTEVRLIAKLIRSFYERA